MPELPEVERGRRLAERVAKGRRIEGARCHDDPIVFDGTSPAEVREALVGRRVLAVRRKGKHLWFELDGRLWPLFHFGMTGAFRTPGDRPLPLASSPAGNRDPWPPRFVKIHLFLEDGGELAMTNARRLGRIRLRRDPTREPPISRLGFDPLLEMPGSEAFAAKVRARKATLKGLLLDQGFAAGVGNWIADEVLYQAGLDPRRRGSELSAEEVERLRSALQRVIELAVAANAEKDRFPDDWLFHRRWGRKEGAETREGEPVEHLTVAGRTTAWVPSRQR